MSAVGLSDTYVDDMVRARDKNFTKLALEARTKFEMCGDEELPCTFTGFQLERDKSGRLLLHHHGNFKQLTMIKPNASFLDFASMRIKMAWLCHSQPECMFDVSHLTKATTDKFKEERQKVHQESQSNGSVRSCRLGVAQFSFS